MSKTCVRSSACCANCVTTLRAANFPAFTWTSFPWACPTISKLPLKKVRPASASAAPFLVSGQRSWPHRRKKKRHDSPAGERRRNQLCRQGSSARPQECHHRNGGRRAQALADGSARGRQGQPGGQDRKSTRLNS